MTDDAGGFAWSAAPPGAYTVDVDTGDGHAVSETIAADALRCRRLSAARGGARQGRSGTAGAGKGGRLRAARAGNGLRAPPDPAALHREVEAAVDRALARQLRPLIEAQAQAEGRLRFNDIMGGLGMIVGLAGAGMWAAARRRRTDARTPP